MFQQKSLLRTFSSTETNKQKSCPGQDQVNREGGAWGSYCFLVKKCWTLSAVWAGVLVNYPSWNRQTWWKSLKKITEAWCSLSPWCQLGHWYGWVAGTLTYLGKPILEVACPPEDNSIGGEGKCPVNVLRIQKIKLIKNMKQANPNVEYRWEQINLSMYQIKIFST